MRRFFLLLPLCFSLSLEAYDLLHAPPQIHEKEWEEMLKEERMALHFQGKDETLHLEWDLSAENVGRDSSIIIQWNREPKSISREQEGWKMDSPILWSFPHKRSESVAAFTPIASLMGVVGEKRLIEKRNCQRWTLEKASELIGEKKILFYTGAGISSPVVPTMQELLDMLGLSTNKRYELSKEQLQQFIKEPNLFLAPMEEFYRACFEASPTAAHWALKEISLQLDDAIVTENIDLLHQKTGIQPLAHDPEGAWLRTIDPNQFAKIDAIVCIGLASDESGLIGWYKSVNPQGTLVAINLECPPYLSHEDVWVQEEIQKALPEILKLVGVPGLSLK